LALFSIANAALWRVTFPADLDISPQYRTTPNLGEPDFRKKHNGERNCDVVTSADAC
jgi:hypothetical protein